MVIHYELILLFALGFSPSDLINEFGFSRRAVYCFHRIYRDAGQKAAAAIVYRDSVMRGGTKTTDNLKKTKNNVGYRHR